MQRMPTLFLSHGAPNVVLHDLPARRFFDSLAASLPRPRAVLVASAHYATTSPAVTASAAPRTIHDFSGFEAELYQLRYDAPGDPALAQHALELIKGQLGLQGTADQDWGFDHGAWSPLLRIYPQADVPLLVLSLKPDGDARWHYRLGHALRSLRDDGVLVIGSGSFTHNLGRLQPPMTYDAQAPWVTSFREWVAARLDGGDAAGLCEYRRDAPHARDCHPSEEHFMPLFVALGAAGDGWQARNIHHSMCFGTLSMDAWRFD